MADGRFTRPIAPADEEATQLGSRSAVQRIAPATQVDAGPAAAFPAVVLSQADTVQIRSRRESAGSTQPGTIGRTASSPMEALFLEEVQRTRVFALFCVALDLIGVLGLPFMGGDRVVRDILIAELGINVVCALYLYYHLRDANQYRQSLVVTLACLASVTAYTAILYWGIQSLGPCMVVLGIYFFSRNQHVAAALLVYGLCAGLQAILAALILSGAISDPGIYTGADRPLYFHLVSQALVQFLFFASYVLARSGRASTLRVIDGLLQAHRQAEQREAAFQEVRQDLDRMLQLGGPGRHTNRVVGAYQVGIVVGRGAMGEVYEARHVTTGERAAVKFLHASVLHHPGAIERFLREAKAAGSLESPHVVRVLDASPADAPLPYLVMEYLSGHDLAHQLRKRRRLPPDKLEQLMRQIASALDEAAEKGIVHRDIKPQNLFLLERSGAAAIWKVLDFGASKLAQHKGTLTEGRVVGTPAYMAPEQARGEDVTPQADVYALAAIAYRCLCGRPPFSGKDLPATLYNVCYSMPPRPSLIAELPAAVDAVLAVGLAKKATDRFESASELADSIAAALAGHGDDWIERRAAALLASFGWGQTP